jgi:hypothetical protein
MARSVKELVGEVQNRKLPNCLHLLFVCSEIRNIIHITPFATYLHRKNKKGNKKQLNIHIRSKIPRYRRFIFREIKVGGKTRDLLS